MTPLHKLPKNVRDLGKLIVAKVFKKLPKVQKIAQSGHTANGAAHVKVCFTHCQNNQIIHSLCKQKQSS